MLQRLALGALLLFAGIQVSNAEDATKAELKKLEGTWQLVSAVTDGKAAAEDFVAKVQVIIKDGKHSVKIDGETAVKEIPVAVDPSTDPKSTTDTLPDGQTILGIYELEGDKLTSCVAKPGQARPKAFAAEAGSGLTLRVFRRVRD
ncbi:TIGR03067 domain-containing protein [bacterium]|nr:TIGR03067 domain-containing protein [bacterium]